MRLFWSPSIFRPFLKVFLGQVFWEKNTPDFQNLRKSFQKRGQKSTETKTMRKTVQNTKHPFTILRNKKIPSIFASIFVKKSTETINEHKINQIFKNTIKNGNKQNIRYKIHTKTNINRREIIFYLWEYYQKIPTNM